MHLYWDFQFTVINTSVVYTKYKSWIKNDFITCETHAHSLMRKSFNIFPSIAYNSMIASNKQRQKDNNIATIQRVKLKEAHEHSKSL